MDSLAITGGIPLAGEIQISGAKNAALPLMAASLMATGSGLTLTNVPPLADVRLMADLLSDLGMEIHIDADDAGIAQRITLGGAVRAFEASYDLVSQMRASILVMGPLLARYGEAKIALPGGCAIGTRPVDLHIKAMQSMGAIVELADGYVHARAPKGLHAAEIMFPFISVGATENAMMAASLAVGETRLINAAREPEIIDLADCLTAMGAQISGAGSDIITIKGVASLHSATHHVIPDRVEAGTYALAAAITKGHLTLKQIYPPHLHALFDSMRQAGIDIRETADTAFIEAGASYQAVDIKTAPYPDFPTDLQAQFMALMTLARGKAHITETIFENRFMHVPELMRMGAAITIDGRTAIVTGQETLLPAPVKATDLRASVSLVLAALATKGTTHISHIYHLDRGYAALETKLGTCGARLKRVKGGGIKTSKGGTA